MLRQLVLVLACTSAAAWITHSARVDHVRLAAVATTPQDAVGPPSQHAELGRRAVLFAGALYSTGALFPDTAAAADVLRKQATPRANQKSSAEMKEIAAARKQAKKEKLDQANLVKAEAKAKAKADFAAYKEQMAAMKTDQRPPRPVAAAVPTKKLNGGGMPRRSKEAAAPAAAGAEA